MFKFGTTSKPLIGEVAAVLLVMAAIATAGAAEPQCTFPDDVVDIRRPLPRLSWRLETNGPVKVVALGSSSTAGAGASTPDAAYPVRLQGHLSALFPGRAIVVENRGRNGDRVGDMLSRLATDVLPGQPDVVIWQLGTNALLADLDLGTVDALMLRGVRETTATGADLIVMDPQFAPKVLAHPQTEDLVRLIDGAAVGAGAALFRRFELMRFWHDEHLGFEQFLSPDQLHMNDWSYGCLAQALARAIARSVAAVR